MAIRNVITGTDNVRLRKTAKRVKMITPHIKTLLDDMKETIHVESGVGLAAPQVGVLRRVAIVEYEDQYYELINPKIVSSTGEVVEEEGCLSVPGTRGTVMRPGHIKVSYIDRDGKEHVEEYDETMARIFCHELDHLDGVLFVDKMIEETE